MINQEVVVEVTNVSKKYHLGQYNKDSFKKEIRVERALKIATNKSNENEFWALKNVTLSVKRGEVLGILGANGSGKSTLLKILSRITAPTEGDIVMQGKVASMLEVGTGFNPEMTGLENIYMNGTILGMSREEVTKKLDDIITFSECAEFINTPVKRYSSGMYVKLAFSVAAHLDSDILIMDEVLAVGDVAFRTKSLEKMSNIVRDQGRTVLFVSHAMPAVRNFCTRAVVLEHGRLIYNGDVDKAIEIYTNKEKKLQNCVELGNRQRSTALLMKAKMLEIEALGDGNADFPKGKPVHMRLKFTCIEKLEGLRIRVILRDSEGNPVGMAYSAPMGEFEKEKIYNCVFALDTSCISSGYYYLELFLCTLDEKGFHNADGLYDAFTLTLTEGPEQFKWHQNVWGKIALPKIETAIAEG